MNAHSTTQVTPLNRGLCSDVGTPWHVMNSIAGFIERVRYWCADDSPHLRSPMPGDLRRLDGVRDAVLVLDASPSMEAADWKPTRLHAARRAARAYVDRLAQEERDARVGIVVFDRNSRIVCGLTPLEDLRALGACIDSIDSIGGGTNITAGVNAARDVLGNPENAGHVVLLTDGCHNTGQNPKRIAGALRKFAIIESVGIGGSPSDVDEALLKAISSSHPDGSKRYRWIGEKDALVQHFHHLAGRITREP